MRYQNGIFRCAVLSYAGRRCEETRWYIFFSDLFRLIFEINPYNMNQEDALFSINLFQL